MGYGPSLEQLPDFTVGADGAYSVHDTPFAPGTYTYEVIFAGDQSHRGTVASTTVVVTDPNSTAGTLTLSTSTNTLPHKGKVTVTAQLQSPTSTKNKTVGIVKLPAGGKPPTTVTGTIDKNGNFSTTFTLIRTATFHATWSGDATHEFTTSGSETVSTYALTEESLGGSYGKSGSYFLYHYSSTCAATQETGCILAAGQVVPWNEVAELCYTWEQNVGSGWTDGQTVCGELDEHGQATLILSYDDDSAIGVKFRVQATFEGSISNLSSSSPWVYFKITS
jgi:hypothetical protein